MVRRPAPIAEVVPGSTPVVAFGDFRKATVATLGINPSWREFLGADGALLSGTARRLATLPLLNAEDTSQLSACQVKKVVGACEIYFSPERNPYRRWFDPLDELLRAGFAVSYYDGTACHLDLVHWATRPGVGRFGICVEAASTRGKPSSSSKANSSWVHQDRSPERS